MTATTSTYGIDYGTSFEWVPSTSSTQSVELAGYPVMNKGGGIDQAVATIPGQYYTISVSARDHTNSVDATGSVTFAGQVVDVESGQR